jgi:hypothetical protein
MQRSGALQPLSRDHFAGLALAKAVDLSVGGEEGAHANAAGAIRRAWQADLADHFAAEEQWFLPLLPDAELSQRLLKDHAELRRLATLQAMTVADLSAFAELLRRHIRWEEREFFPEVERLATVRQLQQIATFLADREASRKSILAP